MPYNLPPPWDPGYALPDNVQDEGLERRAFITKWMPRGTYDEPKVGTGGYAVPKYVMKEGYGQGTFTTKWLPSGTYVGPKVPAWLNQRPRVVREQPAPGGGKVVTVQALGDDAPMPMVFDQYGQKAADAILSRVARLSPGSRQPALRALMDQVDKSLWARTQTITKRYVAQGMPLARAFREGLARALSTGIAAELIDTGLRRQAPQARSLLGLGCYGHMALGASVQDDSGTSTGTSTRPRPTSTTNVTGQTMGLSTNVLVGGLPFDPWRASQTVWSSADAPSARVVNQKAEPHVMIEDPEKLPADVITFLRDQLVAPIGDATRSFCSQDPATGFPEWDASTWFAKLGIDCNTKLNLHPLWRLRTAVAPLARVKSVLDGSDMAMHVRLYPRDLNLPADPTTNPLVLKGWLTKVPDPSLWTTIWKGVTFLPMVVAKVVLDPVIPVLVPVGQAVADAPAVVAGVVKDGLKKLGDLACDLLKTPGVGMAAGAAGAAAAGVPPQAGAAAGQAGAQIAQGACGQPPPTPPLPQRPSFLTLALLGGVAAVAVVVLGKGHS